MNLEIRWFIEGKKPNIQEWIGELKLKEEIPENEEERIDVYLAIPKPHCDFVGIKTREGKFEIKYKIATYNYFMNEKDIQGKAEFWSKYSQKIDNDSLEAYNAMKLKKIAVKKTRFKAGYILKPPKYKMEYTTDKHIDQGLKIEVTDLEIINNNDVENKFWWTIGIDFYGVNHEEILESGLPVIFKNYPLDIIETLAKSFSYPEWASLISKQ